MLFKGGGTGCIGPEGLVISGSGMASDSSVEGGLNSGGLMLWEETGGGGGAFFFID